MKTICLYFQVHQPFRLRRYRFFDIGNDHYYYDDYLNESIIRKVASKSYLPANKLLLELIKEYGCNFKVTFSISGMALDQFELYATDVLESFKKLAQTGCVEFLAETYSHSLVSLKSEDEFVKQVNEHADKIEKLFGQRPVVFRNTELIYSDEIGAMVSKLGYKAMITEGAKHILGWKSPNYMYCNSVNPRLKVLLRNFKLSDDIGFRFSNKSWSEWPLTADKLTGWLAKLPPKEEIIGLYMDYTSFGERNWMDSGIFGFLKALPGVVLKHNDMSFGTPSMLAEQYQPISAVHVPYPISWADEERDITAWLGNELQVEAFNKLYSLMDKVNRCNSAELLQDWKYLQSSDHFYYMSTKFFSDGSIHAYSNPFETPYDAFINYMNVLSDFNSRLNACAPDNEVDLEIARLNRIIEEKDQLIGKYEKEMQTVNLKSKQKVSATVKTEEQKTSKSRVKITKAAAKVSVQKSLKRAVKKVEKKPKPIQKSKAKKN